MTDRVDDARARIPLATELAMAFRAAATRPDDEVSPGEDAAISRVIDDAMSDPDRLNLIISQALLPSLLAAMVEAQAAALLAKPEVLVLAAREATAGHPVQPESLGLDAATLMQSLALVCQANTVG